MGESLFYAILALNIISLLVGSVLGLVLGRSYGRDEQFRRDMERLEFTTRKARERL